MAAPATSLNRPIGKARRFGVVRAPLEDLKLVKEELGGTINDVALAVVSGGLRELLLHRGETPPSAGLRAMVPVNIRAGAEQLALGNRITSLFVHLPVAEETPLARYAKTLEETTRLKHGDQALGGRTLLQLTTVAPPVLHATLARSLFATRLFNVTVTNVPGPQATLYGFGAPLREVFGLVPLAADHDTRHRDPQLRRRGDLRRRRRPRDRGDFDILLGGMRTALDDLGRTAARPAAPTPACRADARDVELGVAIACALAFAVTNGLHDAANAIATLVATRAASPGAAVALSSVFNLVGALALGTAVAATIAGIVTVPAQQAIAVIGSGVLAATLWGLGTWWRGLPSSSAPRARRRARRLGPGRGWDGRGELGRPGRLAARRVIGVLIALAVSPVLGLGFGFALVRAEQRALRRATRRVRAPLRAGEWAMSAGAVAQPRGQRRAEVDGRDRRAARGRRPARALLGAAVGQGRLRPDADGRDGDGRLADRDDRGRRIIRLRQVDALREPERSTAVILGASGLGAPVSTTQVVASSVVGVGDGAPPGPPRPVGGRARDRRAPGS